MVKRHRVPAGHGSGRIAPRWRALLLAVVTGAAGAQQASRPPAAPLTPAPEPRFAIKGFQVTGDNPLGAQDTARVLAPFVRPDATMTSLQQATAALEKELAARGFGLHRVALPPQEVGDTVRLDIVTFMISRVAIEGASIYDKDNIRRTLPELQEGKTPNFKRLAVQTAIANENPNKQVQVGIREGDEPDKIDSTITVKEQRPWTLAVSASNLGTQQSGHDRVTVAGGHTNLFNLDHQFNAAYTTSVEKTSDVQQFGLTYRIPLYALGGVIGATYTRSDVVGNFGTFTSTGAGHTAGVNYTMYLPPEGGRRTYVLFALEDKVFNASRINNIVVPGALDRRSRPFILGYNARTDSDKAVWGYNVDLAVNTGGGAGNDLPSYQSEDPRITTTKWKALRGGINYIAPVFGGWLFGARSTWQYSPDVLIAGEQIGLGGTGSVRGTEIDRPLSADKGVLASVELTTPELAPGLRLLGFVDGGWVRNNQPNGTNKPGSDRLYSVGVGARYGVGNFIATLDYGRILVDSRVLPVFNSAAPQKGDSRVYVNLAYRF
jgi:hemolysin activation/secretion protein